MKEITYALMGRIQDEETGNSVVLTGVKLTGTPLQVGMIFESLRDLPGRPDVSVNTKTDQKIYNIGKDALEQARAEHSDFYGDYEDPDTSDDPKEELARLRSNWRIHTYPTETE